MPAFVVRPICPGASLILGLYGEGRGISIIGYLISPPRLVEVRGRSEPASGLSAETTNLHVLHRAPEPHNENVHAQADPSDERIQQEVEQPESRASAPLRILQFLQEALHSKGRYSGDGSRASYNDTFDRTPRRLSEFCAELVNVSIKGPEVGWQTVACRAHNCYDEDCPDYSKHAQGH